MIKKHYIIACIFSLIASCTVFAWYRDWIIIAIPSKITTAQKKIICPPATITKKKVSLFYRKKTNTISHKCDHETKELLWTEHADKNIFTLLHAWTALIEEEDILQKKITLQSAVIDAQNHELIVSFDRQPYNKQDPAFKKYLHIETLLKTVFEEFPHLQKIRFLKHHRPMDDEHLDFSQSWPIYSQKNFTQQDNTRTFWDSQKPRIIVIGPSGDARHTGRSIDDVFERSITLRCAQELKKKLEGSIPGITIYLTRFSGDMLEPLQNAIFSNRLEADLYISINCYQEPTNIPHISLALFSYEQDYDENMSNRTKKLSPLSLVPLHKTYQPYLHQTQCVAKKLHDFLNSPENKKKYILEPLRAFPYKPLLGVNTVAIGIEFGLPKKDSWHFLTVIIANALEKIVT